MKRLNKAVKILSIASLLFAASPLHNVRAEESDAVMQSTNRVNEEEMKKRLFEAQKEHFEQAVQDAEEARRDEEGNEPELAAFVLGQPQLSRPTAIARVFPDQALAKLMAKELNKTDVSAIITQEDLNGIRSLKLDTPHSPAKIEVKSLEGLQYVVNLQTLALHDRGVTNVRPIANLVQLTNLNLSFNNIRHLEGLSRLKNLEILSMVYTGLTDLRALANFPKLKSLDIGANNIADFSPLALPRKITTLSLAPWFVWYGDGVDDVELYPIEDMDFLSTLPSLSELYIKSQHMAPVPDDVLHNLRVLSVGWGDVSARDLERISEGHNLEELLLLDNGITDLSPFAAASLPQLRRLEIRYNEIEDVRPLASVFLPQLYTLDLSNNYITDLSPLQDSELLAKYSSINFIDVGGQRNLIRPTLLDTLELKIENTIKDIEGNLVVPNKYSDGGTYEAPYVVWDNDTSSGVGQTLDYSWNAPYADRRRWLFVEYSGTYTVDGIKPSYAEFNVDGSIMNKVETTAGELIDKPADPVKEGYRFTGWYPQEKGGKKWVFKRDVAPEGTLTLYARFRPLVANETLSDDGSLTEEDDTSNNE